MIRSIPSAATSSRHGGDRLWRLPARLWRPPQDAGFDRESGGEDRGERCYLLTLGGDHFITLPLLRAHAARHGPLALVHFDAHQDTWPDEKGRIDHGSFLGRAVEEGLVDVARSIQIGIRTHAPKDCGIRILYGYEVEEMSAGTLSSTILNHVGDAATYLTVDIDVLDPAFAPGTGTPSRGGPSSAKLLSVLRGLAGLDIRGSDVVEVAPAYDHADVTAIAASTVAMYMLGLRAERLAAGA